MLPWTIACTFRLLLAVGSNISLLGHVHLPIGILPPPVVPLPFLSTNPLHLTTLFFVNSITINPTPFLLINIRIDGVRAQGLNIQINLDSPSSDDKRPSVLMVRSGSTIQRLPPQKATDPDLIAIRAKLLKALAVKALAVKASTLVTPLSSRAASPGATPRLRSRRPAAAHSPSPRIVVGPNAITLLPVELASLSLSSPLIVSSPSRLKIARKIQAIIPNLDTRILSSAVITVPTRISGRDCVISVGGGSAVTLARAVSLRKGIPHICIPTTFSGSEMASESSTPVPRERGASEGSNSRAARAIARESKTLPTIIIYDDDLTTSSPTRFSAPSDEDIMEDRAEPHSKSEDACWSYINLPGV